MNLDTIAGATPGFLSHSRLMQSTPTGVRICPHCFGAGEAGDCARCDIPLRSTASTDDREVFKLGLRVRDRTRMGVSFLVGLMLAVGLVATLMLTDTVPTPRRPGGLLVSGIAASR